MRDDDGRDRWHLFAKMHVILCRQKRIQKQIQEKQQNVRFLHETRGTIWTQTELSWTPNLTTFVLAESRPKTSLCASKQFLFEIPRQQTLLSCEEIWLFRLLSRWGGWWGWESLKRLSSRRHETCLERRQMHHKQELWRKWHENFQTNTGQHWDGKASISEHSE